MSPSAQGLQNQLNGLLRFCSKNQMIVNELKTKIMIFGKPNVIPEFTFNNKILDIVQEYKYLGVVFNSVKTLKGDIFKNMKTHIADKARKACFAVLKKYSSVKRLPPMSACQLFDSHVSSVLNYAADIWGHCKEIPVIESVHYKFLKHNLGVKETTSNVATLVDFGRYPMYIIHTIKIVKYWNRLIDIEDHKLVKKAYNTLLNLHNSGFQCWPSKVESILNSNNLDSCWNSQSSLDEQAMETLKLKIKNDFKHKWDKEMQTSPILRTYINFKCSFQTEAYLYEIKDYRLRRPVAQFRLSSHRLKVETGRHVYPKIDLENRICELCNLNKVEDELHFLFYCPLYQDDRICFFINLLREQIEIDASAPFDLLRDIFNSDNNKVHFYFAKFVHKAFNRRQLVLG